MTHDAIGVRDDKVGEPAVIFLKSFGALRVGLTRHLRSEVSELLAKLLDFTLGFEVLERTTDGRIGETNGDGPEGACVELWVSLHDIEGALWGKGIIVLVDTVDNFALFCVRVGGNGEARACGSMDGFRGRRARKGGSGDVGLGLGVSEVDRSGGWVHKCDGGGTELGLGGDAPSPRYARERAT